MSAPIFLNQTLGIINPYGGKPCFAIQVGPYQNGELRVVRFRGTESLNEPFRYEVTIATTLAYGDVRKAVRGQPVRLAMEAPGSAARRVEGVVESFSTVGTSTRQDGTHVYHHRVVVVPRLQLLSKRRAHRVFENQTLLDIALAVLTDARITPDVRLDPTHYLPVPFMMQQGESDLDFLNRLFALAGITYFFEHPVGKPDDFPSRIRFRENPPPAIPEPTVEGINPNEVMVIADAASQMTALDGTHSTNGLPPKDGSLAYSPDGGHGIAQESLRTFEAKDEIAPGILTAQEWSIYDYATTAQTATVDVDTNSAESSLQVFEYQCEAALDPSLETFQQQALAARSLARHRAASSSAHGTSDSRRLFPGYRFVLGTTNDPHPIDELEIAYYVTAVRCEGVNLEELERNDTADIYKNVFECVPATVDPRPAKPEDRAPLRPETAEVIGPWEVCDGLPTCDERGRIRVRFHWGKARDFNKSPPRPGFTGECTVQWLERWAGAGYGTWTLPRTGSEVLVEFPRLEGGTPIATGQLYSRGNYPPFCDVATSDTNKVGMRSRTVPSGGVPSQGYNEVSLDDTAGDEHIRIRAERYMATEVLADLTETIHVDRTELVEGNRASTVNGDRTVRTLGNVFSFVTANETRVVAGMLSDTVTGPQLRTLVGPSVETYADDAMERHTGHKTVVVGDGTHKRSHAVYVNGSASTTATGTIDLATDTGLTITCGDTTFAITKNSVAITSPTITLNGKTFAFTASDAATITAKSATVTASDALSLSGKDATLNGSSSATVGSPKTTVAGQSANVVLDSKYTVQASAISLGSGGSGPASQAQQQAQTTTPTITTITLTDTKGNPIPNVRVALRTGGKGGVERVVVLDATGSASVQGTDALDVRFPGLPLATLQGQSAPAPAIGDVVPYFVRQGEYLASLAQRFGFDADAVWNHSKNADLKKLRTDPNLLAPGDMLFIAKTDPKWTPLSLGVSNVFVANVASVSISLRLTDTNGPLKGVAYAVEGADIPPGNLTDDGVFLATVASSISEFVLVLPNRRHAVRIGHLDPIITPSGVIQRLVHLGYLKAEVTRMEDAFFAGIDQFRNDHKITTLRSGPSDGLDPRFQEVQLRDSVGTLSTNTLEALLSAHGS